MVYGLVKYVEIERELLQDFQAAHVSGRITRMKICADALVQFKVIYYLTLMVKC